MERRSSSSPQPRGSVTPPQARARGVATTPSMSRRASEEHVAASSSEHHERGLAPTELLHLLDDRVRLIHSLEQRVKSIEGTLVEHEAAHGRLFEDQLGTLSRMERIEQEASALASAREAFEGRLQELGRQLEAGQAQAVGGAASEGLSEFQAAAERRLAALELRLQDGAPAGEGGVPESPERHVQRRGSSGLADSADKLASTELLHMLDDRVRLISRLDERVKKTEQLLEENDARHSQAYDDQVALAARTEGFEQEAGSLAARLAALEALSGEGAPASGSAGPAHRPDALDDRVKLAGSLDARVEDLEQRLREAGALAARVEALEARPQEGAGPGPPGAAGDHRLESLERAARQSGEEQARLRGEHQALAAELRRRLEGVERQAEGWRGAAGAEGRAERRPEARQGDERPQAGGGRATEERVRAAEQHLQESDVRHSQLAHDLQQERLRREAQMTLLEQRVGEELEPARRCGARVDRVESACRDLGSTIASCVRRLDDIVGVLGQLRGHVVQALGAAASGSASPWSPKPASEPGSGLPDLQPLRRAIEQMRGKPGFDEEVAKSMDASISRAEQSFASVLSPEQPSARQAARSPTSPGAGAWPAVPGDASLRAELLARGRSAELVAKDAWRQVESRVSSAEAYMRAAEEGLDREFKRHVAELSERLGRLEAASPPPLGLGLAAPLPALAPPLLVQGAPEPLAAVDPLPMLAEPIAR